MQVCTALQTDYYASTPPLSFLQAGCPSCRPSNSVKALKAKLPAYRKTLNVGVTFISRILQAKENREITGRQYRLYSNSN